MMVEDPLGRPARSREINVAFALAHLSLTVVLVVSIARGFGTGWDDFIPFVTLLLIDFPLSGISFVLIPSLTHTQEILTLVLVHCIAGTLWYYHLPSIFRLRWNS